VLQRAQACCEVTTLVQAPQTCRKSGNIIMLMVFLICLKCLIYVFAHLEDVRKESEVNSLVDVSAI
jgi:hypothetical protein